MPHSTTPDPIRKITDQVELIDWLIEQVKAQEPEMIGAGEVTCFDTLADEYKYGHFAELKFLEEYLKAVFDNIADQHQKVSCSPAVRYLAAEALGYGIYIQALGPSTSSLCCSGK
ncbi:hypothetical protein [Mesorhizobium sp. Cs1321R2N1]|uniref:hypothetical protein n=1 Tax=Mesorhizobium sp. Cs1321R2N1 TaxID=3015174 RepID=UPI00301D7025